MSVNQICIYHIMLETYGIVNLKSSTVLKDMMIRKIPKNKSAILRSEKIENMLQIPMNEGRNNGFNFYATSAWNKYQNWQKQENSTQLASQQKHSMREECTLKVGLGLKCCCISKYCNNIPKNRPMTDKEILLKQRKESERALKEFKRQIKVWILKEIPQD